jgi:hypothetical protein
MRRRILPVTSVAARALTSAAVLAIAVVAVAAQVANASAAHARPAASKPKVTVRVEGLKKTRLLATTTSGRSGWITKGGTPSGQCSGRSAAGALDAATRHNWNGSWSAKYQALSVIGILGERHPFSSQDYWSLWVNNKYASSGVCGIALKPGEQLLFAAEPDNATWYPTVLSAPHNASAGHPFTVKLTGYSSSGRKPLKGVAITGNGIQSVKTNHSGQATIKDGHSGRLVLRASPKGFVRSEAVVHVTA